MSEPKKKINSRSKGRAFEQKIATQFREWLGEEWVVSRNPTDRQHGQVKDSCGEFTIDGPRKFPWAVECKAVEAFDYNQLWTGKGPFGDFWAQAVRQADIAGLQPLLIFKRNLGPILAATWDTATPPWPNTPEMVIVVDGRRVAIVLLESFLAAQAP